jgi:hypothetical protein
LLIDRCVGNPIGIVYLIGSWRHFDLAPHWAYSKTQKRVQFRFGPKKS